MEITDNKYVFQVDSSIVKEIYNAHDNYLIEYSSPNTTDKYCAIYFSSNDIYYPNTEEIFRKRIIQKNSFEWYNLRIKSAQKHIFVRDIFKQWYLAGINHKTSSPMNLLDFLRKETTGYKIITLGSSAGGFSAVLFGSLLNAEKAFSFNGQFELNSLLNSSTEEIDPIIFRNRDNSLSEYFDIKPLINTNLLIYYFFSSKSQWDIEQYKHIKELQNIRFISVNTSHHGIPFLKCNLPVVINLENEKLDKLTNQNFSPIVFSIEMVGIQKTISGFIDQAVQAFKKRR